MNENSAKTRTTSTNPSGTGAHLKLTHSTWTSIPQDEAYEKRIFELECYIDQIEHRLIIAEMELSRHKRENCA